MLQVVSKFLVSELQHEVIVDVLCEKVKEIEGHNIGQTNYIIVSVPVTAQSSQPLKQRNIIKIQTVSTQTQNIRHDTNTVRFLSVCAVIHSFLLQATYLWLPSSKTEKKKRDI